MTNDSFRKFRCWRTAEVQQTVFGDIGSLGTQDDAVFLAAHAPVPIERQKGPAAQGDGEAEILNALRDEIGIAGRNTLMAITGDVGTGKSHAVRWVRAHLEADPLRYRTIYVPRDLSTLRSLLGRILDGMPGPKAQLAATHLDDAIGAKPEAQLKDELIDNLRQVLAHELPDEGRGEHDSDDREERSFLLGKREDRNARRRDGLADILLNLRVIERLSRDGGTVAAVVHSLQAQRSGRDEDYPQFTPADLPTSTVGISNRLDPDARTVWEAVRTDPAPAIALLNEALHRAVPMTLGFGTGITLGDVFRETRELLRRESAELVLLFEDLALFGLIDDDLYDQFILQPGDAYCPLRVVFAITTARYERAVPDSVRDRVSHHYVVQNLENEPDSDADPAMVTFVARYLNNARVGRDGLIAARSNAEERTREAGTWVPNACEIRDNGQPCLHRDECFSAFGSADIGPGGQVGLYPHNEVSLRRAFRHLRDGSRLSPRSLVNDVVQSFLVTAEPEIGAGIFPTEEIQNWLYLGVTRAREAIVPDDAPLKPEERERLRRARIAWADGEREPPGIHLAFDLPGDAEILDTQADPGVTHSEPTLGPVIPPVQRPVPSPPMSQQSDRTQSLYDWESDIRPLPNHEMDEFRTLFHRWTRARLDLGRHLMYAGAGKIQFILNRIFPAASFVIENAPGAEDAAGRLRFDVPQSAPGLRLLMAARWFADHGHWDAAAPDRNWEFPPNYRSADLQVELENFLSDCAATVEERFLSVVSSADGARPATVVVTLRAAALRILGQLGRDDAAEVIAAVAKERNETAASWSSTWQELAQPAAEVIRSLEPGLIADFASARQGDSDSPIVIDAAALEPAGLKAIIDPAAAIADLGELPELLSDIDLTRRRLTADWTGAVAAERQELLAGLRFLRAATSSAERDIAAWAGELGTRANDDRVFRPVGTYPAFRQKIETLKSHPQDVVNGWIGAETAIGDPDDRAAVFDAQSWAAQARLYVQSLRDVLAVMEATAEFLDERLARHAGESPDTLANRVADQLDDAGDKLERLGQAGPS